MSPSLNRTAVQCVGRLLSLSCTLCTLLGCDASPVESLPPAPRTLDAISSTWQRRKVDILFVIDNTRSMVAKQRALAETFGSFLDELDALDLDYHIGFSSTDVGSWAAAGSPWQQSTGACDSFSGDDGALQAVSCLDRTGTSTESMQACSSLCPDRRFVPRDRSPFLSGYRGFRNVPSSLEPDPKTGKLRDRGPEYALRCMGLLGDSGCGLTAPLESMKRALDGHSSKNFGFLRAQSTLWVILVTDKDDCSVSASSRVQNDPLTISCPTPMLDASPFCFDPAFRCLASSIRCTEPMNTPGIKTGCEMAPNSYLRDVRAYSQFLAYTKPLQRFHVTGLWTLPSVTEGAPFVVVQDPLIPSSAGLRAAGGSQAACQSSADPRIVGYPQLRLQRLLSLLDASTGSDKSWDTGSICAPQRYLETLEKPLFGSPPCQQMLIDLPHVPQRTEDGTPLCVVGDVDALNPSAAPSVRMPHCGSSCCHAMGQEPSHCGFFRDEVISACESEPQSCYCIVGPDPAAPAEVASPARIGVWRPHGAETPEGTVLSAQCASKTSLALP